MVIVFDERFESELNETLKYIAQDSKSRARAFKDELLARIEALKDNPRLCKPSKHTKRKNAHDLIFKGYTAPYFIDDDKIVIVGFFKWRQWQDEND